MAQCRVSRTTGQIKYCKKLDILFKPMKKLKGTLDMQTETGMFLNDLNLTENIWNCIRGTVKKRIPHNLAARVGNAV